MTDEPKWGQLALDIQVAAKTKAPVLISAPADCAVNVARAIAAFASVWKAADVVVCDCAGGGDLGAAVASARAGSGEPDTAILLLREVHALGETEQAEMARVFTELGDGRLHGAPRIISTTSVSLFDRVLEGAFDERLFYRLNALHIVIQGAAGH
jgi:transcriptional regulator of acetoin/glycerol metabolism